MEPCSTSIIVSTLLFVSFVQKSVSKDMPPFGRAMRSEFLMAPDYINLNHGAFGTIPRAVQQAMANYDLAIEAQPELWLRRDSFIEMTRVRQALGELINADKDDIVLVPNTTTGMNAILRSLQYLFGDRILYMSTVFSSMRSIVQFLSDTTGNVTALEYNLTYPISNQKFLWQFESWLDKIIDPERPIRLAIIDHLSAFPGVRYPVDELVPMLKKRSIPVLLDGAHAIGQVPIDIQKLQPDYYVSSCHKWLYAGRSCGLMYVDKKNQPGIHPAVIGLNYRVPSNFQREFYYPGTPDYNKYMSVLDALEFRREVGGEEKIMEYIHELAWQGGNLVAQRLGTEMLEEKDQIGATVDIRLPIQNPELKPFLGGNYFRDLQFNRYNKTYCSVHQHGGHWWVKISAQIYNDLSDFEVAADQFKQIVRRVNSRRGRGWGRKGDRVRLANESGDSCEKDEGLLTY